MGTYWEYTTTAAKMAAELLKIVKEHGPDTRLTLKHPGLFDAYFEGRNSCLTVEFDEERNRAIIIEKDIK
jgi:hypothetical protein